MRRANARWRGCLEVTLPESTGIGECYGVSVVAPRRTAFTAAPSSITTLPKYSHVTNNRTAPITPYAA